MRTRRASLEDLERVTALEAASYPEDEAASRETLAQRLREASDCFLLAEDEDGALLGFVCGTRSGAPELTHASMSSHEPRGGSLCVHSVVVAGAARRRGLGTQLLRAYLEHARGLPGVERVLLICKQHLLGFYGACGFALDGPSPVVHGCDPWFAMRQTLEST